MVKVAVLINLMHVGQPHRLCFVSTNCTLLLKICIPNVAVLPKHAACMHPQAQPRGTQQLHTMRPGTLLRVHSLPAQYPSPQPRHCGAWVPRHTPPLVQRRRSHIVVRADKQQQDPNIVEGYDIDRPDIWESEFLGTGLRAAFVALCVALVVTLVYLATPLIDYVVEIYPSPEALTQVRTA